jgi:hypothetical protein
MRSSPRGRGGGESEMPAGIRVKTGRERFGVKWVNRRVFERSSGRRRCDGVGRSYIELSPYIVSPVESAGICWSPLESTGIRRSPLESTGVYWSLLESTGVHWNPLESTGTCGGV